MGIVRKNSNSKYVWFHNAEVEDEKIYKETCKRLYAKIYRWNSNNESQFLMLDCSVDNKVIVKRIN